MARAALRPRSAFRLRMTKSEKTGTGKTGTGKTGTGKTGKTQKAEKPGKAGKPAANGRAAKNGRTESRPVPRERHVLPLPLRLLAMLCAFGVMVGFAVVLAKLTLEPSPASVSMAHTNLHPGTTLRAYLDQPGLRDAVKQIGGNLDGMHPCWGLVPLLAPRAHGVLRVRVAPTAVRMAGGAVPEGLVEGRAFDIDDVILNTTGALIGYVLVGRRLYRAVHAKERVRPKAEKRTAGG